MFVKYTSASTAIAILVGSKLRWSSPLLFNDPFDVPRELVQSVDRKSLHVAIRNRVSDLVASQSTEDNTLHPGIRVLLANVRASTDPAAAAAAVQKALREDWPEQIGSSSLEAMRSLWRSMLPDFRILCLTESPRHTAMWHHYAEKYSGVALAFECVDALDSAWLAAKPVNYPCGAPPLHTAEGWATLITTRTDVSVKHLLDLALYTKSPDWAYEAEWRVAAAKRPSDSGLFSDFRFARDELVGVYLGPLIATADRDRVVSLARDYRRAELHQVSIGMSHELEISNAV